MNWFLTQTFSDKLSIAGLILTLIGFGLTLWQFNKTKIEIGKLKQTLELRNAISNASGVIPHIEELGRIAAGKTWEGYPDKSGLVCTKIAYLIEHPQIGSKKAAIQAILLELQNAESKVRLAIEKDGSPSKSIEIHQSIISSRDLLTSLLADFSYRTVE